MSQHYTAVNKRDGDWWLGWIEEIQGVNGQERSKEELLESLREALNHWSSTGKRRARQLAPSSSRNISPYEA